MPEGSRNEQSGRSVSAGCKHSVDRRQPKECITEGPGSICQPGKYVQLKSAKKEVLANFYVHNSNEGPMDSMLKVIHCCLSPWSSCSSAAGIA